MALTKISRSLLDTGVSDSSDATAITITSDEEVGIGTTSPVATLQVKTQTNGNLAFQNSTSVTGGVKLNCFNDAANASSPFEIDGSTLQFNIGSTEKMRIDSSGRVGIGMTPFTGVTGYSLQIGGTSQTFISIHNTTTGNTVNDGFSIGNDASNVYLTNRENTPMIFSTNNTERMRIDSNGLIGIGTTAPASNGGANAGLIHLHGGSADWSILHCTTPTTGSGAADGAFFGTIADDVYVFSYETGSEIYFGVGNSVRIKIDSSGNLAPRYDAGYSGHSDLGTSSFRYEDAYVRDGVTTGSDRNEKENITESDLGLTFIKELNPVSYTWKNNSSNRTHYGLIAQDIETWLSDNDKSNTDFAALIKEDISEEQDGSNFRYGLRYTEFISPLIKAIQELTAKVEELESKINE